MLAKALAVVEAVRTLEPYISQIGIWRMGIQPRALPAALREIGEALQALDKATAPGLDQTDALAAMIHEPGSQIDIARLVDILRNGGPGLRSDPIMENVPMPGDLGRPDKDPSSPDGYFHGHDGVMNRFAPKFQIAEHEPALKGEKDPDDLREELKDDEPDSPSLKPGKRKQGVTYKASTSELEKIEGRLRSILARIDVADNAKLAGVVAAFAEVKADIANQPSVASGEFKISAGALSALVTVMKQIEELDRELMTSADHDPPAMRMG
ncbi:hypothetical protein [Bosea sp. RAC05]|uniref:hypothetical protein n=1 Tax=Bosea sp. RAC05 TaxID=1842539 RepID=UPI00083E1447|nr:hypothetical protein [Bosea sp. RAC05]AOG03256.1 hypothetical protein BSY19_5048 [Bosea sp. RAC05]